MNTSCPVIINQIFKRYVQQALVPETILLFESSQNIFTHQAVHGDYSIDHPFLTASLTKLFTTCLILQLVEEGPLKLDDHLQHYLETDGINLKQSYTRRIEAQSARRTVSLAEPLLISARGVGSLAELLFISTRGTGSLTDLKCWCTRIRSRIFPAIHRTSLAWICFR